MKSGPRRVHRFLLCLAAALSLGALVAVNAELSACLMSFAAVILWVIVGRIPSLMREARRVGFGEGWRAAAAWRKAIEIGRRREGG